MKLRIFLIGLILLGVISYIFYTNKDNIFPTLTGKNTLLSREIAPSESLNCISKIQQVILKGNSLSGLIEPGVNLKILSGYYNCNEIKRNDLIAYSYAGNSNPIIKIVKGIPGDKFNLQETINGWHILLNNEILKNAQNQPYILDEKGYRMLSLYEKDYHGVIPLDTYLILGNLTNGSLDSTYFGLISKNDILGKIEQ